MARTRTKQVQINNPYRFRAYAGAATSLPAGDTKINCNQETYDPNSNYDTSTSRYTAPVAGTYSFKGSVAISAGGSIHNAQLRVNGALVTIGDERTSNTATNHYLVADDLVLAAGDYVELYAYNSGGTVNTNASASFRTYFSGFLISTT